MTPQRVSLITLGVDDLERSAQFYQSLGWQRIRGDEEVVFFQINGMALGLFGKKALAKDQGRPGAALGTGAITLAQNFRTEKEVDGAFAKAISAGAQPLKIPQSVFLGRLFGLLRRSGRPRMGNGIQPFLGLERRWKPDIGIA